MGILSFIFRNPTPQPYDPARSLVIEILSRRPASSALEVVRLAHMAHIEHAGRMGSRIVPTPFKASAMGPINKEILAKAKTLITLAKRNPEILNQPSRLPLEVVTSVATVCELVKGATSAQIVAHIHRPGGCWHQSFRPCPVSLLPISDPRRHTMVRRDVYEGDVISFDSMVDEYFRFPQTAHAAAGPEAEAA